MKSYNHETTPWAPAGFFSEGGKPAWTGENGPFFSAPKARMKNWKASPFWRFTLNLRAFHASAQSASENFRVFYAETTYDVIIFKFRGGGPTASGCPPPHAHGQHVTGSQRSGVFSGVVYFFPYSRGTWTALTWPISKTSTCLKTSPVAQMSRQSVDMRE